MASNMDERFTTYADNEISFDETNNTYSLSIDGESHDFYQPDFNYKQFNTNLVTRWEFHPGSVLYLVWSSDITDFQSIGDLAYKRDIRRLIDVGGDNVLLVKFSYLHNI